VRAFTRRKEDKRSPSPRPSPSGEREKTGRNHNAGLSPLPQGRGEKTGRDHNAGLFPLLGERARVRALTRRKEDKRFPLSPALSLKGEGENRT